MNIGLILTALALGLIIGGWIGFDAGMTAGFRSTVAGFANGCGCEPLVRERK